MVEQNKERQKSMSNILLLEDDLSLINGLSFAFKKQGFELNIARTLKEAEELWTDGKYDLLVLDVSLPDGSGFEFCKRVRLTSKVPIIFLTASVEETSVIMGLDIGGDDYITKPFGIGELRARVAAHIRRENREKTHTICIGEVRFSMQERKIYVQEHELVFTKAEYTICEFLALNHGQVFSKERILEHVFGFDGDSNSSAITEHVKNIRAKFQKFGINPIETVWGIGYRWK